MFWFFLETVWLRNTSENGFCNSLKHDTSKSSEKQIVFYLNQQTYSLLLFYRSCLVQPATNMCLICYRWNLFYFHSSRSARSRTLRQVMWHVVNRCHNVYTVSRLAMMNSVISKAVVIHYIVYSSDFDTFIEMVCFLCCNQSK